MAGSKKTGFLRAPSQSRQPKLIRLFSNKVNNSGLIKYGLPVGNTNRIRPKMKMVRLSALRIFFNRLFCATLMVPLFDYEWNL